MRRITLWLFSTVAALVLLFSYRTSTGGSTGVADDSVAVAPPPPGGSPSAARAPYATGDPTASPSASHKSAKPHKSTKSSKPTSPPPSTRTYTGATVATRWGDVQVRITVAGGRITAVAVPKHPDENSRDVEINAHAVPILVQETLQAQNANIQTVSGATYTSNGYRQSLQSALDAGGLA